MNKTLRVSGFFGKNPKTLLLLSGGVDSAVLALLAARSARETVAAITFRTEFVTTGEIDMARRVAGVLSIKQHIMDVNVASDPMIMVNARNRCYICRKALHAAAKSFARNNGFAVLADGAQENDMHCARPGIEAAREDGVRHPLAEAEFTKQEIRTLAREARLPNCDRPSAPCLATRFPFGTPLSVYWARKIEEGEKFLAGEGLVDCRIRLFSPGLASIEVEKEDIPVLFEKRESVLKELRNMGFSVVSMDMEGLKRGKMERFPEVDAHDPD